MSHKPIIDIFINGKIEPTFISDSIAKHSSQTNIGAHSIFVGVVRSDNIKGKSVIAIDYTAHKELALAQMHQIREEIFEKYPLTCLHIYHSLGMVKAGEICLFALTSSKRRKPAVNACTEIVERIKAELPIWGQEIFEDETYQWKKNS